LTILGLIKVAIVAAILAASCESRADSGGPQLKYGDGLTAAGARS